MNISFNHVAMRVRDVDASVQFVHALLGDDVIAFDAFGSADGDGPRIVVVGSKKAGVFFDVFSGNFTEAPKQEPPYGMIHYCFGVDDVDAAYQRALDAGAEGFVPPRDLEFPDRKGQPTVRVAFVYDPNGDVCEFIDHDWIDKLVGTE